MTRHSTSTLSFGSLVALVLATTPALWPSPVKADSCFKRSARRRVARPSRPQKSPRLGSLVPFVSTRDGVAKIYVGNPDGSSARRLTRGGGEERNPCPSPDGRVIVFQSNVDGNWEIYTINSNGTNRRRLTRDSGSYAPSDTEPVFSPDGRTIAWTSTRARGDYSDIWIMNSTGEHQTRLTTSGADHSRSSAVFSPTGGEIAYLDCNIQMLKPTWALNRLDLRTRSAIQPAVKVQVRTEGDDTTPSSAYYLRYNSDGTRIAYVERSHSRSKTPLWSYEINPKVSSSTPGPTTSP